MSKHDATIFGWPVDKPAHEAIGEAIGAASMCWKHVERAGVFDSTRAAMIADELEALLKAKLWIEP